MGRPPARELTERELEVMHVFWQHGEQTAAQVRDRLEEQGLSLSYVTVANLVRILEEKGFIALTNDDRPYRYRSQRTHEDVSGRLVSDLIRRVFRGSREQLLKQLVSGRQLTAAERAVLREILQEGER
ncbi:MAG: BlaI/MecI/CopY family transcriptional regulator [Pirellulaceae bacterium]